MNKYRVIKSIPSIKHPRNGYIYGVDWSKDGLILAAEEFEDFPKRLLMWQYGSSYSNRSTQVYCPPSIYWLDYSRGYCMFSVVWSAFEDSGHSRLSRELLVGLGERIAEEYGLYFDWRAWNRKETLIFTAIEK